MIVVDKLGSIAPVKPLSPHKPAVDLRAYLEGSWEVVRSIEDRHNDAPGNFTGQLIGRADFIAEDDALNYQEHGRLKTAGFDDDVHQQYTFKFPEQHYALVSFRDGRAFHDLDLSAGSWRTRHNCDPDVYDGAFEMESDGIWHAQWIIHGPRKDMTIRTTYTRITTTGQ